METIINYKISEFFSITDIELITNYLAVLEVLKPLKEVRNPRYKWYKKEPKKLPIKQIRELSFGEVALIKTLFSEVSIEGILEAIKMVLDLKDNHILDFTILEFYGIISFMKEELMAISNLEINELSDDNYDRNLELVNANERMSRFGVFNVIDSLSKEDILRWSEIEKLPYMTVFTKLTMDKEKYNIQQEIAELQKQKQLNS